MIAHRLHPRRKKSKRKKRKRSSVRAAARLLILMILQTNGLKKAHLRKRRLRRRNQNYQKNPSFAKIGWAVCFFPLLKRSNRIPKRTRKEAWMHTIRLKVRSSSIHIGNRVPVGCPLFKSRRMICMTYETEEIGIRQTQQARQELTAGDLAGGGRMIEEEELKSPETRNEEGFHVPDLPDPGPHLVQGRKDQGLDHQNEDIHPRHLHAADQSPHDAALLQQRLRVRHRA